MYRLNEIQVFESAEVLGSNQWSNARWRTDRASQGGSETPVASKTNSSYYTHYSYDENGNLTNLVRNGQSIGGNAAIELAVKNAMASAIWETFVISESIVGLAPKSLPTPKQFNYIARYPEASMINSSTKIEIATTELTPTHYIPKSKSKMSVMFLDIKNNGISEPIKYVEYNGTKYIVDGHHRYYSALRLGLKNVPVEQVNLPYLGYRTAFDLMMEAGKHPGY